MFNKTCHSAIAAQAKPVAHTLTARTPRSAHTAARDHGLCCCVPKCGYALRLLLALAFLLITLSAAASLGAENAVDSWPVYPLDEDRFDELLS